MTNPPDNLGTSFHTSSPEADEKPIEFEPGKPKLPEKGKMGNLASIEAAEADLVQVNWAIKRLKEELSPALKEIDDEPVLIAVTALIHHYHSLGAKVEDLLTDLEIIKTIKPAKEV